MGVSVQFVGITEVMKAFDNMKCVKWSVCQGKALNFSYSGNDLEEGRDDLEEWLKMIGNRTTQAIYTLKFYEGHKEGRITAATPETTSFNFRLCDELEEGNRRPGYPVRYNPAEFTLLEEVRELKQEIKTLRSDQEKQPAAVGSAEEPLEFWEKILDHPIAIAAIGKVLNIDLSGMMAAGKIAGVPEGTDIDSIIEKLYKFDPDLDQHLYKLSVMAEKNPANFKVLLSMLDKM